MNRTKIICTIGPATATGPKISSLIKSGMRVARLNFSHGTHANHKVLIKTIRSSAKKNKMPIPIIADLQGPKIRIGELKEDIKVKRGQRIKFTTGKADDDKIPVTFSFLHKHIKRGDKIMIDDGLIETVVLNIKARDILCEVKNGGSISSHKGMNFPDSNMSFSSMTPKDKRDLEFVMSMKVDFIALSFVRRARDVRELKKMINNNAKRLKVDKPKVISKIEKGEALENFPSILKESDAIMVARGDLGIEIPAQYVPLRQKEIIALSRQAGKPVIVATQMLDSMIRSPRPTRAEVSDVANAVMDNVDAVMLSGETATGKYPKEAVGIMSKIIDEVERSPYDDVEIDYFAANVSEDDAVGESINLLSRETGAKYVIDLSGRDLYKYISKWKAEVTTFAVLKNHNLSANLFWGVRTVVLKSESSKTVISALKKAGLIKGKKIIVLNGDDIEILK